MMRTRFLRTTIPFSLVILVLGVAMVAFDGGGVSEAAGLPLAPAGGEDTDGPNSPLLLEGFLVVRDGEVHLCESLAESFPPQCGGIAIAVEGLDITSVEDLRREGDVLWTEDIVQVGGTFSGDVLIVVGGVRTLG